MKKSFKKFLKIMVLIVLAISFLITAAIIYLNNVYLPTKIKALVIKGIEQETGKFVKLDAVRINIFKGFVLYNLVVSDDSGAILKVKEASCIFLPFPILKKKIIVPLVSFENPEILIVRNKDNTFSFQDFLLPKQRQGQKEGGFDVVISRININNGKLAFRDEALPVMLQKNIENIDLVAYLALPFNVRFSVSAEIPSAPATKLKIVGDFKIPDSRLLAKVSLTGFKPQDFSVYYRQTGFNISSGVINSTAALDLRLKYSFLNSDLATDIQDLIAGKDKFLFYSNSQVKALLSYNFKDKNLSYSGKANILNSSVSGVETVEKINSINGDFVFSNSGISCESLLANIWEIPLSGKVKLADFSNPYLDLNISSVLDLAVLQKTLKEKLKVNLPATINGRGKLSVNLSTKLPVEGSLPVKGELNISQAVVKLDKIKDPFMNISGRVDFGLDQATWQELYFSFSGVSYKTNGKIDNFKTPLVALGLASDNLNLDSEFSINNKLIKINKLSGKYLDSDFLATGTVNNEDAASPDIDINGTLDVNLSNIKEVVKKFQPQLDKLKPKGRVSGQFVFRGNPLDWKNCLVDAALTSASVSCAGFSAGGLILNYNQSAGIINVPQLHLDLYDGVFDSSGSINLNSTNYPYWFDVNLSGLKIEKLKLDTSLKDKDISGTIKFSAKLSGFLNDLAMVNGSGKINIKDGKLWQLDLFQGIGSLLFVKDFANIAFSEGDCGFVVKDKYVSTENLVLRSNIANLFGPVKIGFDSSINAQLSVEVLSQMVPLTGTYRDVATAILGQAEKFAIIEITETLQKPKIKFKTAYFDIFKGLADTFLKSIPH
ncbi:MAG: AsmA family protein [Candidatus Omnitrophica bacterium]|nr:AsmA family protein [Candidatus Omnitrophota bacterium]